MTFVGEKISRKKHRPVYRVVVQQKTHYSRYLRSGRAGRVAVTLGLAHCTLLYILVYNEEENYNIDYNSMKERMIDYPTM